MYAAHPSFRWFPEKAWQIEAVPDQEVAEERGTLKRLQNATRRWLRVPEQPVLHELIIKILSKSQFPYSITNRRNNLKGPQAVQAVLLCAQHLGSRHARAGQLLTKDREEYI
ncbi:hypothetical protein DCAR_0935649 [Daucus carota subsp. sativus]|uniref:Uncharacterized protein n=1 Tax=Daucus carota subsp. sativus TaxID=79200 RepID=A0A175YIX6_DAUCS|nr:hypothetical protein DCAR_0935649 [Daucus carota subsp. sativus]